MALIHLLAAALPLIGTILLGLGAVCMITAWTIESDRLEKISMWLLLMGGITLLTSFTLCSMGFNNHGNSL